MLKETGFHPLDGARFLRSTRWEPAVCDLVAHHSGNRFVATVRGLSGELAEFARAQNPPFGNQAYLAYRPRRDGGAYWAPLVALGYGRY